MGMTSFIPGTAQPIPETDPVALGQKGAANGLASLDANSLVAQAAKILRESGGQDLPIGAVAENEVLQRVGNSFVGAVVGGGGAAVRGRLQEQVQTDIANEGNVVLSLNQDVSNLSGGGLVQVVGVLAVLSQTNTVVSMTYRIQRNGTPINLSGAETYTVARTVTAGDSFIVPIQFTMTEAQAGGDGNPHLLELRIDNGSSATVRVFTRSIFIVQY